MSKVSPILFDTDMVRATLDGSKTVMRQAIKPQPVYNERDGFNWKGSAYGTDIPPTVQGAAYNFQCASPYQPGDILYVRETWGVYSRYWWEADYFMYRADFSDCDTTYEFDGYTCDLPKWRPSVHMPKEAARIWLKVTDVRVERLQEITISEIIKEGCADLWVNDAGPMKLIDVAGDKNEFTDRWNLLLKKKDQPLYGWKANPWVWRIAFERCKKPEVL